MEILRTEDLTRIYGEGNNQTVALDHVSFSVDKGEIVAIVALPVLANQPCCIFWER